MKSPPETAAGEPGGSDSPALTENESNAPAGSSPAGASTTNPALASPPGERQLDIRVLRAIRRIIRRLNMDSKHLESHSRITAPQLGCLLELANRGPKTATALGKELHLSASTVVGILDRLEEKGLVTREREREDRRVVRVSATAQGVAVANAAPSPLQVQLAQGLSRLPTAEQAAIAASLERLAQLMEGPPAESAAPPEGDPRRAA